MGPKKKSKKKGDKKKKAEAANDAANSGQPEVPMEDGTKQFYMTQIQTLRKKVSDLQGECDGYLISQQVNADRLDTLKEIRSGSRAYLSRQMDEINLEIKKLNDQLRELDEVKEAERLEFTKQIHDLRTKDLQETREKNENENHILRSKLNALDDLKSRKESLLNEINQLDEQLKQQDHDYQEEIYHREKDAVLDKDKLRKEMTTRVNDLSSEFRRVSKMQVVQTTRQIILENVRLNNQMSSIEDEYNVIEANNGKIRSEKKSQSLELSLLEERERMMAKKNRKTQQLIEKLTDECSANEQFIGTLEEKLSSFDDAQQLINELEEMNSNAQQRRAEVIEENEILRRNIGQREETLLQCEDEIDRIRKVTERTVQALRHTIDEGQSEGIAASRVIDLRVRTFHHILQLMNLATQFGIGPKLNELAAKTGHEIIDDQEELPSPRQPLGSLKRVKSKSVGTQTNISNRNPVPYQFPTESSSPSVPPLASHRKRRPSLLST